MSDFINKIITLVLIFIMLVLAPLLLSYMSTDMVTERLVLNDVTSFIDKVTDKGTITNKDLDTLYLDVNSHGQAYNVKVQRYIVVEEPVGNKMSGVKSTNLIYVNTDDLDRMQKKEIDQVNLNIRDVVKVHVEEINLSSGKRLLWTILRVDKGKTHFSMAGTVR